VATPTVLVYVDDANVSVPAVATVNANIDYTDIDFAVGARVAGTNKIDGLIAELWLSTTTFIDLTVTANRRKFVTADLRPVYLGVTGEIPTGSAPIMYMSGDSSTWFTNKGTGGGFTLHGELDDLEFGQIKCFNSLSTTQDRDNFTDVPVTLRFAHDVGYLPAAIYAFPFIKSIDFTPAIVSLGVDMGQRASLKVVFKDAPHADGGDSFDKYPESRDYDDPFARGTFWGKFRARNNFLRGRAIRLIRGLVGDALADMETRHFIIESFDGPTPKGEYTIIAKDVLKLADGDRAQAPFVNTGFLSLAITNVATAATLSPAGVGDEEYDASGYINIGGNEICSFSRIADALTLGRAQLGTTASAHDAQDRVQQVLSYSAQDPALIIYTTLLFFAGVPAAYLPLQAWLSETENFLGTLYTGVVAEPMSAAALISEIIQQAGLVLWWDDENQVIRLQVLRAITTTADEFTAEQYMEGSLDVKEQPAKRVSQVWTYFGKFDPTKAATEVDNYRSLAIAVDDAAELDYGTPAIYKRYSRWIPSGGRSVADRANEIHLARYRDPPRMFKFNLMRYAGQQPTLGGGYQLEGQPFQDATGALVQIPIQVTRLDPGDVMFEVEAEEVAFFGGSTVVDPTQHTVIFDSNIYNQNLRTVHDLLYPTPVSGDTINCIINAGVIVGSTSSAVPALIIGDWPVGVTINVFVNGRIQGKGGDGGSKVGGTGTNGEAGGTALYTRAAINLTSTDGDVWGGGGGGAGDADGSGGGGAGQVPGLAGGPSFPGSPGTTEAGGAPFGGGGAGGGPGLAGQNSSDATGGAAGTAIDGDSFVTDVGAVGDIRGAQIN
jgi:hypothetical protein